MQDAYLPQIDCRANAQLQHRLLAAQHARQDIQVLSSELKICNACSANIASTRCIAEERPDSILLRHVEHVPPNRP